MIFISRLKNSTNQPPFRFIAWNWAIATKAVSCFCFFLCIGLPRSTLHANSQSIVIFQPLQALDKDRDGFITKKEFQMMNKAMTPTQVSKQEGKWFPIVAQVKRMMKRFDDNGDGKLDLEEFQRWFNKIPQKIFVVLHFCKLDFTISYRFMGPKKKGERRGSQTGGEGQKQDFDSPRRGSSSASARRGSASVTKIQIGGRKE